MDKMALALPSADQRRKYCKSQFFFVSEVVQNKSTIWVFLCVSLCVSFVVFLSVSECLLLMCMASVSPISLWVRGLDQGQFTMSVGPRGRGWFWGSQLNFDIPRPWFLDLGDPKKILCFRKTAWAKRKSPGRPENLFFANYFHRFLPFLRFWPITSIWVAQNEKVDPFFASSLNFLSICAIMIPFWRISNRLEVW